jgi:gluconolactonase
MPGAEVPDEVRVFAAGLGEPETPVLLDDGRWAVVEMDPDVCTVTAIAPDGSSREVLAITDRPNGVAFDPQGRMWVAINSPVPRLVRLSADGRVEASVTHLDGVRLLLPNDLCFGPDGRLWMTDSGIALDELLQDGALRRDWAQLKPDGRLFSINAQTLRGRLHDRGLAFANGVGFSPRGEVHVSETMTGAIHRYRGDGDDLTRELVGNARRQDGTVDFHGPDGFAFDTDGRIYIAVYGQGHVAVLSADGTVERRLPTGGALPTNVAFGPDRALYVTEAERGRLERLPVAATGAQVFFGPRLRDSMGAREARA